MLSARETSHPQPPIKTPQCAVGIVARTHWGVDSPRVMGHQSANSAVVWCCREVLRDVSEVTTTNTLQKTQQLKHPQQIFQNLITRNK